MPLYKNALFNLLHRTAYVGEEMIFGSREVQPITGCPYDVASSISSYEGSKNEVWELASSSWYMRNNLGHYEKYGVYGESLDTYYIGKLAIVDGREYEYTSTGWKDLGECTGKTSNFTYSDMYSGTDAKIAPNNYVVLISNSYAPTEAYRYLGEKNNGVYANVISSTGGTLDSVVWQLVPTDTPDRYYLKNASTGRYMGFSSRTSSASAPTVLPTSTSAVTVGFRILSSTDNYDKAYVIETNKYTENLAINNLNTLYNYYNWWSQNPWTSSYTDNNCDIYVRKIGGISPIKEYDEKEAVKPTEVFDTYEEMLAFECAYEGLVGFVDGVRYVYTNGEWIEKELDYDKQYLTIESLEDNNTVRFLTESTALTRTISASTDGGTTWTGYTSITGAYTGGTVIATLNIGDKLLLKGTNTSYANNSQANMFVCSRTKIYGNIMSLTNGDNFVDAKTLSATYTFRQLLYRAQPYSVENLILPATALTTGCYDGMLWSGKFEKAPKLPATTLANGCYQRMFYCCTSLTEAPELPAMAVPASAYSYMFVGCTSLTEAPELPATTVGNSAYSYMFWNCISLTKTPAILPAPWMSVSAYTSMFGYCTSLTEAPELPAPTVSNYCYKEMFIECTNLNYVKCLATDNINKSGSTSNWLSGVASTGTFVKASSATWPSGNNGIPNGWTVQDADT